MDDAVSALPRVMGLDRRAVRRRFEERFTAARMARDYVNVYRALLKPSLAEALPAETDEAAAPTRPKRVEAAH
jgi:hypothetical protein